MNSQKIIEYRLKVIATVICLIFPMAFLMLYEIFAGGVFNGFAGSEYRKGVVDGSFLTGLVYPSLSLVAYATFVFYFFRLYKEKRRRLLYATMMVIVTIIALFLIFWRDITT